MHCKLEVRKFVKTHEITFGEILKTLGGKKETNKKTINIKSYHNETNVYMEQLLFCIFIFFFFLFPLFDFSLQFTTYQSLEEHYDDCTPHQRRSDTGATQNQR